MFTRKTKQKQEENERKDLDWPSVDITFLDEEEHDEVDTFFRTPFIPRVGEILTLDGYFVRSGTFVVERVEYMFFCETREAGWVRDLGIHANVFVRVAPMEHQENGETDAGA